METYVFKNNKRYFLVNAISNKDAWDQLQAKMGWSTEITKVLCKFIGTIGDCDPVMILC